MPTPLTDGGGGGVDATTTAPPPPPPPSPPPPPPPTGTSSTQGSTITQPGTVYIDTTATVAPPATSSSPPPPPLVNSPPPPPPTDTTTSYQAGPILQHGIAYVDDPVTGLPIPAPDRTDLQTSPTPPPPDTDETPADPLKGWTLDDPFATRSLESSNPPLKGFEWLSAMADLADLYRLDPKAIAADVLHEGSTGRIGDSGLAYGPFQDHLTEFQGRPFYGRGKNNVTVNRWAWSRNGLDYSMRLIAFGEAHARGLTGHPAVAAIVKHYEKPADIPGETSRREGTYDQLQSMGGSWVAYVAGRMLGPASGGGQDNVPVTGQTPKASPTPTKQWKATLHFLANDVPAAGANARKGARRAADALRSSL